MSESDPHVCGHDFIIRRVDAHGCQIITPYGVTAGAHVTLFSLQGETFDAILSRDCADIFREMADTLFPLDAA